jgi:hypothetical protein
MKRYHFEGTVPFFAYANILAETEEDARAQLRRRDWEIVDEGASVDDIELTHVEQNPKDDEEYDPRY